VGTGVSYLQRWYRSYGGPLRERRDKEFKSKINSSFPYFLSLSLSLAPVSAYVSAVAALAMTHRLTQHRISIRFDAAA